MRLTKNFRLDKRYKGAQEAEAEATLIFFYCAPIFIIIYLLSIFLSGYNGLFPSNTDLTEYLYSFNYKEDKVVVIFGSIFLIGYFFAIINLGYNSLKQFIFKPLTYSLFFILTGVFFFRFFYSLFSTDSFIDGLNLCFSSPSDETFRNLLLIYLIVYFITILSIYFIWKQEKEIKEEIQKEIADIKSKIDKLNDELEADL